MSIGDDSAVNDVSQNIPLAEPFYRSQIKIKETIWLKNVSVSTLLFAYVFRILFLYKPETENICFSAIGPLRQCLIICSLTNVYGLNV